ncbi:MAG TPA: universal stress protein [Planctomycetota bacterium]|nr:universal stress protein [Planctomycetota bacterium]
MARGTGRPEDFLELLERSRRGRLKLYLGFAAGVGKTYRMLEEAHALKKRGVDVVLGYIEPHDRAETLALVEGLEVVPRHEVEFHGVKVEEMDLDAVLKRKPTIVIVDEIPHTNVPGARHRKRYEDVLELLDAGINVIGAMNIQHLESLNDLVRRATNVSVRETVPDSFLSQADQIVNVDVSIEELLERLKSGKVYRPEKVEQALTSFFIPENLESLREVTLREIAEDIGRRRERSRTSAHARPPSSAGIERAATADRVLVCLASNSPQAKEILRRGSRLAGRLNERWFVVYVETPHESPTLVDAEVQRRLHENLELARSLGAEIVKLEGTDVAETILDFARKHEVQHIVVGRSRRSRWRELLQGSVIERLLRGAHGIDIHVMTFEDEP